MRTGFAIRDRYQHGWLQTRVQLEGVSCPVTVWVGDETDAMEFRRLKDAKAMLRVLRKESRRPDLLHIINPQRRVVV